MKIQKKYQGAIPLNRISNQEDNSELNTYSTIYLNEKHLSLQDELMEAIETAKADTLNVTNLGVILNGEPLLKHRQEIDVRETSPSNREYCIVAFVGNLSDGEQTRLTLPEGSLLRNAYGVVYYSGEGTFMPISYPNPNYTLYWWWDLKTRDLVLNHPSGLRGSEFVVYAEYVQHKSN